MGKIELVSAKKYTELIETASIINSLDVGWGIVMVGEQFGRKFVAVNSSIGDSVIIAV